MSTVAIALLGLLLLMALVAFGLGQARWSWASVAASFLIVLTLGGYLYLAARLLQNEWKWVQSIRSKQIRLHGLEDATRPASDGRLQPIPGQLSLEALKGVEARWLRALERVDTWRGRRWEHAAFVPPEADDKTGTLELPAPQPPEPVAGDEPAAPSETTAATVGTPLDPGMTLYLFDDTPFTEGGRYLGAFIVEAIDPGDGGGQTVTLRQTAQRDPYDTRVWQQDYDNVSVFDRLPTDRWAAFSATPLDGEEPAESGDEAAGTAEAIAPRPARRDAESIAELVAPPYLEDAERHAQGEPIEKANWPAIRAELESGTALPGQYWAEATFSDPVDRDTFLGLEAGGDSLKVEIELETAFELADEQKVEIENVFYRRPLLDAETIVHGSVMPPLPEADGDILADGLAAIMRSLRRDIAALDDSNQQLDVSQQSAEAERALLQTQSDELSADLTTWARDVAAAERTTRAFAAAAESAAERLTEVEREVAELGAEIDAEIGRAVDEIDRLAPPPAGRAAGSPAAAL